MGVSFSYRENVGGSVADVAVLMFLVENRFTVQGKFTCLALQKPVKVPQGLRKKTTGGREE